MLGEISLDSPEDRFTLQETDQNQDKNDNKSRNPPQLICTCERQNIQLND